MLDGVRAVRVNARSSARSTRLYFRQDVLARPRGVARPNLLGDHLDASELVSCVGMMAVVADRIDDELQKRFGKRFRQFRARSP